MQIKFIGIIDGTNKGHCMLSIENVDGKIQGTLFIHDVLLNRSLTGKVELVEQGNTFQGRAFDFKPELEGNPKSVELKGQTLENGREVTGEWKTDVNTQGTLRLFKHEDNAATPNPVPTAFLSKKVSLPACKLGIKELGGLLMLMRENISPDVQPSFTVNYRGSTYFKVGVDPFLKDNAIPDLINDLSISINEANYHKGFKVINLNFKPVDGNSLDVSGDNSTWVNGRAAEIQDYISRYNNRVSTFFTKYGPNLNLIIFLIVLVLLPSINQVIARVILMTVTIALLWVMSKMYTKYFPKAVIYLGKQEQGFLSRNKDAIFVGLFATVSGFLVTILANKFATNWDQIVNFLNSFIAR